MWCATDVRVQKRIALTSQLESNIIELELPSFQSAVAVLTVRHCLGIDRGSQKQSGFFVSKMCGHGEGKKSQWSDNPVTGVEHDSSLVCSIGAAHVPTPGCADQVKSVQTQGVTVLMVVFVYPQNWLFCPSKWLSPMMQLLPLPSCCRRCRAAP